jgi:hypothetical protein
MRLRANPDLSTWRQLALIAILVSALPADMAAQSHVETVAAQRLPEAPPEAVAVRVERPPVLDGEVLDDPAWASAPVLTDFWQTAPEEGRPASERTEVRIVYTGDTLYFGIVCYDRAPGSIIVADSRRDSPLDDMDSFQIILDTYRDRQNGFVFGTNPAGLEFDGQVVNEGQVTGAGMRGGRQQAGSGSGFNINWDGSWRVRTSVTEIGWSAEFAIPFRTLRYRGGGDQQWGLNLQRNIRRRKETSYWSPLPRQFNLHRLSLAGTLNGLQIPAQRQLAVTPYVLGHAQGESRTAGSRAVAADAGVDLKYGVTPSLTLDATYNTDFAQVEVDEQQINLDRFTLFFPEKRPFFLENAGLFSVGSSGEAELFFSRRIGIGPGGVAIPILAGARLSGMAGGTRIGMLDMQTEEVSGVAPANNFSVLRVSREFGNRSAVGGIFVNRQATGRLAGDDDHNRSFALDGRVGLGSNALVSGFAARTATPGLSGDEHAFKLGARLDSQTWLLNFDYTEVGRNFNPEVGFLSRRGFRKPEFLVHYRYRPSNMIGLQEVRPHVSYRAYFDFDGFQETGFLHMDNHWEWKSGHEVHTAINVMREGVVREFSMAGVAVPPGTYDHAEAQIIAFTNQGAPLSARLSTNIGGFFGGRRKALTPSVRARLGERFNAEVSWQRNDIDLPGGSFVTNLTRGRLSYSFSPRLFVQALLQHNDLDDMWSANVRLGWLQQANTGVFIVFNDVHDIGAASRGPVGRSLVVKISRMLDLLN